MVVHRKTPETFNRRLPTERDGVGFIGEEWSRNVEYGVDGLISFELKIALRSDERSDVVVFPKVARIDITELGPIVAKLTEVCRELRTGNGCDVGGRIHHGLRQVDSWWGFIRSS